MPRLQRRLILLMVLVNCMIFFLILLKIQSTLQTNTGNNLSESINNDELVNESQIQEPETDSNETHPILLIRLHFLQSPFGKKEDQLEQERDREEIGQVK